MEVTNLSRVFRGDFALSRINLDVLPGEVHVIVGENGSGKSVIMKTITGLFPPDSGEIRLDGSPVRFASIHEARSAGVLYQHQDLQLFDNMSVADNVCLESMGRTYSQMHSLMRCREIFDELDVGLQPSALLGTLGYAEKQLVAVIKTLATPARVVILDEPSSAMSESEREVLFRIVRALRTRGTGVFYISHRLDEIREIGDRVSVIHRGHRVATSPVHDVSRTSLVRLMTGRSHHHRYPRTEVKPGPVVLSVRHLRSDPVLSDVSFDLHKGEIIGITGLMGSGRTRLAHCLIGEQPVEAGTVTIRGRVTRITTPGEALAHGLVLVPEDRIHDALFARFDLTANVTISSLSRFRTRYGLDLPTIRDLVRDYAERLAINPGLPDDIIGEYSGGNQQKAIVARAFMNRGTIYLLDEPTRGVDVAAKVDIYNAMNDLVAKGASIILFSSEIDEILGMADRIMVLAKGRIAGEMSHAEATKEAILNLATDD